MKTITKTITYQYDVKTNADNPSLCYGIVWKNGLICYLTVDHPDWRDAERDCKEWIKNRD